MQWKAEQINGREGETVTLFFSLSVFPKLARGGFAPRHLNRSTSSLKLRNEF